MSASRKKPKASSQITKLTDVIQHPSLAFSTIQTLRGLVEDQEKQIAELTKNEALLKISVAKETLEKILNGEPVTKPKTDPFKDGEGKPVVPGYPYTMCDVVAPASKACGLGKGCKCIQAVGHTTPHRAKCGARWANRKRS